VEGLVAGDRGAQAGAIKENYLISICKFLLQNHNPNKMYLKTSDYQIFTILITVFSF